MTYQATNREPGCIKPDTDTQVFFYEQDFYVLSNFSAFSIFWSGKRFDTSEHLYHWLKFSRRPDLQEQIRTARSAHEAFKLAGVNKEHRRPDWDDVKVELMRDILRAKVDQHEYVRRKLLDTGDRILIEDSWRDDFWGWGPSCDGQNMLGKLWMEVRAELRAARGVPAPAAVAWVPIHPRNGPLWSMTTDKPNPERLPSSYPLRPLVFADGVKVVDEREQFEAAMGDELKVSQGQYALSRAHMTGRPYTFLATIWAWEAWQRARGVATDVPTQPDDLGARYSVEFDGFTGTVIGSYKRLDGEEGVVMQQDGCKVVHVYRRKWLKPIAGVDACESCRIEAEFWKEPGRQCVSCLAGVPEVQSQQPVAWIAAADLEPLKYGGHPIAGAKTAPDDIPLYLAAGVKGTAE